MIEVTVVSFLWFWDRILHACSTIISGQPYGSAFAARQQHREIYLAGSVFRGRVVV